jgi:hypothetical protein
MKCPRLNCGGTLFEMRNKPEYMYKTWKCVTCNTEFSDNDLMVSEHRSTIFSLGEHGDEGSVI